MALKKARRREAEDGLNITSKMDMMTIILVFLLKSYLTQDISIALSEDLELPVSSRRRQKSRSTWWSARRTSLLTVSCAEP